MNIIYKFHFLNGITEINLLFHDILILWPAPVYILIPVEICTYQIAHNGTVDEMTGRTHPRSIGMLLHRRRGRSSPVGRQGDMAFRTSDSTSEKRDWEIPDAEKCNVARSFVISGIAWVLLVAGSKSIRSSPNSSKMAMLDKRYVLMIVSSFIPKIFTRSEKMRSLRLLASFRCLLLATITAAMCAQLRIQTICTFFWNVLNIESDTVSKIAFRFDKSLCEC